MPRRLSCLPDIPVDPNPRRRRALFKIVRDAPKLIAPCFRPREGCHRTSREHKCWLCDEYTCDNCSVPLGHVKSGRWSPRVCYPCHKAVRASRDRLNGPVGP